MPNTKREEFDPIVEILRLAYRRGLVLQKAQDKGYPSLTNDKVSPKGGTMDKQSALERIDWILTALQSLEQAIERNDRRTFEMELRTARSELKNLRENIENLEDRHITACTERATQPKAA